MTKSSTNRPTHLVYVVNGDGDEANWSQIAAAWQHKDSDGMSIFVPPGVFVTGKLVIRAIKGDMTEPKKAK
jgi:hypothetical protein